MQEQKWVMSGGGPLICMETRLVSEWGGIDPTIGAALYPESDYDRACRATKYLEAITLRTGLALIVGDEPLDTAFWQSSDGKVYLSRISYCESDFHIDDAMQLMQSNLFDKPQELLEFAFASSQLALFDSACPGVKANNESATFTIEPGHYEISTQVFEPDDLTSLILHRFDRKA